MRAGLLVLPFAAFGTAAQACPPFQLSAYPNPPPQAANVTYTFDRGLYGNGQPGYILNSGGVPGCPGGPGPPGGSGGSGQGGQAAGQITTNTTNAVVIGTGVIGTAGVGQPGLHYGALISASGGDGGDGGTSGSVDNSFVVGGAAGAGAAGGVITGQFGGNIFPNGSDAASVDFALLARGGNGGGGGGSSPDGIYAKAGGVGAAGGNGGTITLTGAADLQPREAGQSYPFTGVQIDVSGGSAGNGGGVPDYDKLSTLFGAAGGAGGSGGSANVTWQSGRIPSLHYGIEAIAEGGTGGSGGNTDPSIEVHGGNAGAGGAGGVLAITLGAAASINVVIPSSQEAPGVGMLVAADGGNGGNGGLAGLALSANGGSGGQGGGGGTAASTSLGSITYDSRALNGGGAFSPGGQAILVQANGGSGGAGAGTNAVYGGSGGGGFAGRGGSALLVLGSATARTAISTLGDFTQGVLMQSIGGGGGDAGHVDFAGSGGAGAAGGNGGPVYFDVPNASVIVNGANATGVLLQSIGGGGGAGADSTTIAVGAALSIGGNGGLGGNGASVNVDSLAAGSVIASIQDQGGAGVLAQSVGGSGGSAGSASSKGVGLIAIAIGGDAGGGGSGGPVTITSSALVTTFGDHAAGIEGQSIGGGGGKGGAAFSFLGGVVPTVSVAVGGRGGGGGPGGDVSITNNGQITTYGPDAYGVLMQSIGGGGGSGGAAAARAVSFSPTKYVPAVSITTAIGGSGGAGNSAGTVMLDNSGLVTTAGDGAIAVLAQAIGGGGGTAGDSTAASYASGSQAGLAITVATAIGGTGGSGGTGGNVNVTNEGLLVTFGQDAIGVLAQSVGGGGGAGGNGDATATTGDAKASISVSIAVGGGGGTGGNAGTVSLGNSGAITTSGDAGTGIFAQSVGGGGGIGGGGTAAASGGNISVAVGVGGSGGVGGNGNTASVVNSGSIVTRGASSHGIEVQSIGGGGGVAGKGASTAGGPTTLSKSQALYDLLLGGFNASQTVIDKGDNILQIGQTGENIQATFNELMSFLPQPQSSSASEEGAATQINVSVSVGGNGGAAGGGGAASATNTGSIHTFGAQSDGIFAQSVGGGGGAAGASTATGSASDDSQNQLAVGGGGRGGAAGDGGPVTVINGRGGSIVTEGVQALGVFAQSVGGGGGVGSIAGVVSGSLKSLSVGLGGNGGGAGNGGTVSVTTGDGTADSAITTLGKNAIGILAQSVGGGGGVAVTMTTDQTFDPSKILNNPQGRVADVQGFSLNFGGQGGSSGNGGAVDVTASGPIMTQGLDAHAIVAQSIGGGGGLALGGQVILPGAVEGAGGATGDGGPVTIKLQPGTAIGTTGDGAFGVIAQSIGGGGGFAGDPSAVQSYRTGTELVIKANSGSGAAVSVTANGVLLTTSGRYAPGILAQSIGGGGGVETYSFPGEQQEQDSGSAGGNGAGSGVSVSLVNSTVKATGVGSAGILAQSDGASGTILGPHPSGAVTISIDAGSQVVGGLPDPNYPNLPFGRNAAAIRILGGTNNKITNAGTIVASTTGAGYAILADPGSDFGSGNTTLANSGSSRATST